MHTRTLGQWRHDHVFGQDETRPGERRTLLVIAITALMMVIEVAAGLLFGSMALLADGLHMASHAAALGMSAFAYLFSRRYARDQRFTFGTGKVNALGGFSSALLLAVFALVMAWESIQRLLQPIPIVFDQAIVVAAVGLLVNGASLWILGGASHEHPHRHDHDPHHTDPHRSDYNLRAAYLHVLADALTSVFAIIALLAGKFFGLQWLDPFMGLVGAGLVARWSWSLLGQTAGILLDREAPPDLRRFVLDRIEREADNRVSDLHLWSIAPGLYAAEIAVVSHDPGSPEAYRELLRTEKRLVHVMVEVHRCGGEESGTGTWTAQSS